MQASIERISTRTTSRWSWRGRFRKAAKRASGSSRHTRTRRATTVRAISIVFNRPLGIKRNAVVLPKGYALVAANIPVQVIEESDGRINVSFMNANPGEAPLVVTARRLTSTGSTMRRGSGNGRRTSHAPPESAPRERPMNEIRVSERAYSGPRDRVLPEGAGDARLLLYHDYTETREGVDQYVNVVRAGSTVSSPQRKVLDTGEVLKTEIMTGRDTGAAKGRSSTSRSTPTRRSCVIPFAPVKKGSRFGCGFPRRTPIPRATRSSTGS